MSLTLQLFLLALIIVLLGVIIHLLRSGSLTLKYSLVWLAACVVLFIMVLIPSVPQALAHLIGIEVASNLVFLLEGIFVLIILISLTIIVSKQNARVVRLVQTVAVLERRIRDLEESEELFKKNEHKDR